MPLYFAYGSNMNVERHGAPLSALEGARPRAAHAPPARGDARGLADDCARPALAVHGVLWDLALADVAALDRYEGSGAGPLRQD